MAKPLARMVLITLPLLASACQRPVVPALPDGTLVRSSLTTPSPASICQTATADYGQLAAALGKGQPAEDTPIGQCLKERAETGNASAALALGDAYIRADEAPAIPRKLDLRGRAVRWYRQAALLGWGPGEMRLAQALDTDHAIQMPGAVLAYYQLAASHGQDAALKLLAITFADGRIEAENSFELRRMLQSRAAHDPAWQPYRTMLDRSPEMRAK